MDIARLKEAVYQANMELVERGLVLFTWGNASGFDPDHKAVVIKPSGVDYASLKARDMVVVDLEGKVLEGELAPSSDLATHLVLYRAFPQLGGVVHTHSTWATVWAQARRPLPCLGTTHADTFYGPVACTRPLTDEEIAGAYEKNTGLVMVETLGEEDPMARPAMLVAEHGSFAWGKTPGQAVYNAAVLEQVAQMAAATLAISPGVQGVSQGLLDKHYFRKHGPNAYYGQKNANK